jgi:hypothetical protein
MAPKTADDWKNEKGLSDGEKQALDAELALIASRSALRDAQNPDPAKKAFEEKIAAANAAKSVSDSEKAAADAEKAKTDAQTAAFKAQFGDIPSSGYSGSVDLKDKAGSTESALLAARAINLAADAILLREKVKTAVQGREVWVFALGDLPSFQSLLLFRSYIGTVRTTFKNANDDATSRLNRDNERDTAFGVRATPLVAAGLGLDAINKLLGFFRTDYSIGGVDLSYDDTVLVHSIAGKLQGASSVRIPSLFNHAALSDGGARILKELTEWESLRSEAERRISLNQTMAQDLSSQAAKVTDNAVNQQALTSKAQAHTDAAEILKKAIAIYESVAAKLTAPDDKGIIPLATTIREQTLFDILSPVAPATGGLILIVKVQRSGGAYYTKKNLWSFFGGMPLYHMGGVVVSFVLLKDGGTVADAAVVPVHGGFIQATKLAQELNQAP